MEMTEYCPRCRTAVQAVQTVTHQRRRSADGICREVLVRTLHCTVCRGFLRSEEVPLPRPGVESDCREPKA